MMTEIAVSQASESRATAPAAGDKSDLVVGLARTGEEVRESQRLRYRVFADELGARLKSDETGLDTDPYDPWCRHLLVRDRNTGTLAACTRILPHEDARQAGGFYSGTEFELAPLLDSGRRLLEIGRTCVHPAYRSGAAISMLWLGLARCVDINRYDYLIGCASIPMYDGGAGALAAYARLRDKYLIEASLRCAPRLAVPPRAHRDTPPLLPPLLKAYMRLGAQICGPPCWDPGFNCADLLIALSPARLQRRYARRFLEAA